MGLLRKLFSSSKEKEGDERSIPHPGHALQRERRTNERKTLRLPAEMGFGVSGIPENVYVRDFSDQGIYLLTQYPLDRGAEIDIYMNVPDATSGSDRRVHYIASVKRVDEFRGDGVFGIAAVIRRCQVLTEESEQAEPQSQGS
jgi:hypothetical protein